MLTHQMLSIASFSHEALLWLLIILSVISVAIMLDRFFFLRKMAFETSLILEEILSALATGRNSHMKLIYNKYCVLEGAFILKEGWEHIIKKREHGLEEMLHSRLLMMKPQMESRLGFLATVGSNAPFIGLLGTIFGVMEAFQALAVEDPQGGSGLVMAGISKALIATAVGLIVAIPAVTAYNFLQKKIRKIFYHLESIKSALLSFVQNCDKYN